TEQPRRADDEVLWVRRGDRGLARELRAAVRGQRTDLVRLDVWRALGAVEDVVARGVDDRRAGGLGGGRDEPGPLAVDARRLLLMLLGAVDVGPGGAIDHDLGAQLGHRLGERGAVGDVEVSVVEPADAVTARLPGADDVASEHAARTGDEDPGHGIEISELSPT